MTIRASTRPDGHTALLTDRSGAETFASRTIATIDSLIEILDEETRLLKAADYSAAKELTDRKAELVNTYAAAMTTIGMERRSLQTLAPESHKLVLSAHEALSEAAARNLPVVERARDVSLRVLNGISKIAREKVAGPTTYTANATSGQHGHDRAVPLAINSSF